MRLHDLKRPDGAVKTRKRLGRGPGSGLGKTSGKGHKGARARKGYSLNTGFEGGQMPLQRRVPKFGFKNPFRKEYALVNVGDLNRFDDGAEISAATLKEAGLINKILDGIKILGNGDLEKKLVIHAAKASKSALEKIQAKGGEVKLG